MQELVEASGSYGSHREAMEVIRKPWKSSGSCGSHQEVGGRQGRDQEGCRRVRRGAGGLEGVEEVQKVMEKC